MKIFRVYKHEWKFDLPWHMANLKDWFYKVNVGHFGDVFLHVRVLGIRSLWTFPDPNNVVTRRSIVLPALDKSASKQKQNFPFTVDEKELPEWYHLAKSFFQEISVYSASMYEDMGGYSILCQIRYAAERDYYRWREKSILDKLVNK